MTFEEELLAELDDLIKSGCIFVEKENEKYFSGLSASFPICGSKIDWGEVPGSIEEIADGSNYLGSCIDFFKRISEENGLKGNCILIGDSAIESAFILSVDVLGQCLKKVLEVPQHHYIIAENNSWCMSFTMEGEMAFGNKP
jgi:hypothetical protein